MELSGDSDGVAEAAEATERFIAERKLEQTAAFAVMVCLDEVLSNFVRHNGPSCHARVLVTCDERLVRVRVTDDGHPFNPLAEATRPDLSSLLASRPIGGLGLHIVRTLMDDVSYRHDGKNNILTMSKRRTSALSGDG